MRKYGDFLPWRQSTLRILAGCPPVGRLGACVLIVVGTPRAVDLPLPNLASLRGPHAVVAAQTQWMINRRVTGRDRGCPSKNWARHRKCLLNQRNTMARRDKGGDHAEIPGSTGNADPVRSHAVVSASNRKKWMKIQTLMTRSTFRKLAVRDEPQASLRGRRGGVINHSSR